MKAKINYKSRKTIIIIAIAVLLLIAAIIGTVAFIKGNRDAAAAMTDDQPTISGENQGNNGGESGDTNNGNPETQLPNVGTENNGTTTNEGTTPVDNNNEGTVGTTQNGQTTVNGTTGNAGTTTTTGTTTVPNQEYTQTTTVTTENPWETRNLSWNPISISSYTRTANLNIYKPSLDTKKFAYVEGDSLEELPVNEGVKQGQKITYVIEVKNLGTIDAKNIRTIDLVPEGTKLDENSISNNGKYSDGKITWKTDIKAGENVKLSFIVEVIAENGEILNTAIVNGKTTNTTETEIKHNYTIEHYKENLDGSYELVKTEIVYNVSTGDNTHYTPENFEEFTFNDKLTENKGAKVPDNNNLVIKLYYTRNSYTITYKITGNIDPTDNYKTETKKYEENVDPEEKPSKQGYTFIGWENEPTIMPNRNVIVEGHFEPNTNTAYIVNHYTQKLKGDVSDKVNGYEFREKEDKTGTTGELTVAEAKNYEGFTSQEFTQKTIAGDGSTVVDIYYTRNSYDYVINHVEKGNETNILAEQEKGTAKYGATVSVNKNTNIEGFSYDSEDKKNIVISTTGNEATVYYVRNTYKIIYQITGNIDPTDNYKTEEYKYEDKVIKVEEPSKQGYTFSGWTAIPETMPSHDVYVRGSFVANTNTAYIVNHYIQKLDGNATDKVNGYEFKEKEDKTGTTGELTTATAKNYEGFTPQEFTQETIAGDGSTVVNIYYTRNKYEYKVEHYTEKLTGGYKLEDTDSVKDVLYGSETNYEPNSYKGFTFNDTLTENKGATVPANNNLVIKLYYTRNTHTITYKITGTVDVTDNYKSETKKYGDDVEPEAKPSKQGYTFVGWTNEPTTMPDEDVVVEGYFQANTDTAYIVNHYIQKLNGDASDKVNGYEFKEKDDKTGTTGELTSAEAKDYEGFTPQEFTQETIAGDGSTVVNIYYTRNNYNYTVKYYYEEYTNGEHEYVIDENKTEGPMSAPFQSIISDYDDKNITGYEFDKTENLPLTIGKDESLNEIRVYYKKLEYTYKVEYYTKDLNAETYTINDNKTVTGLTGKFGDPATYTVKDITGFTYNEELTTPINATIPANNDLVIKLYYDRNSYEYSVEYYYDGKQDKDATESGLKAEYGDQITEYPDKANGYTLEKDTAPLTIGTVIANNVIKVYYAKPAFTVTKSGPSTAKVGETITYTIVVKETGNKVGGTIKVTDALPEGLSFVEASDNGILNNDGNVEWTVNVEKGKSKSVTVKVNVNNNQIGKTLKNTAIVGDTEGEEKIDSEKITTIEEIEAVSHELVPGQTGKDAANIIIVLDLSSSMNEKIRGEFTECTHTHEYHYGIFEYCPEGCKQQSDGTWGKYETNTTRLEAAKKSAQDFVNSIYEKQNNSDPDSKATVTVVTFNNKDVSSSNKYVGPRVLTFGNSKTTATASDYSELVSEIGNINIGTATSGYGTYMKEALDATYNAIYGRNGVASKYPNNSNNVIFLGDGEPSNTRREYLNSINTSANSIKNYGSDNSTPIYSIGFGEDASDTNSTAYKVLKGISSNNTVYTASDSVTLTNTFKNLAGGMQDKPSNTSEGKIEVTPGRELYFNTEDGKAEYITVQYKGDTLIECKNMTELEESQYLSYENGKLIFDVNKWNSVDNNTKITSGGEDLVLNYYIVRAE